jgi:hypothetical protein
MIACTIYQKEYIGNDSCCRLTKLISSKGGNTNHHQPPTTRFHFIFQYVFATNLHEKSLPKLSNRGIVSDLIRFACLQTPKQKLGSNFLISLSRGMSILELCLFFTPIKHVSAPTHKQTLTSKSILAPASPSVLMLSDFIFILGQLSRVNARCVLL